MHFTVYALCRCGALHRGDQINAINGKLFNDISLIEANAILRACTNDFCRIEITPTSALASSNMILEQLQNRGLKGKLNPKCFLFVVVVVVALQLQLIIIIDNHFIVHHCKQRIEQ